MKTLVAILAAVCVLLLWRLDHVTGDRMTAQLDLNRMTTRAEGLQNTLRLQRELIADAAERDRKHTEDLANANQELEELRGNVGSGSQRLLVKATCPAPGVPDTASAAGMGNATAAELDPAARQDYFALRGQMNTTEAALAVLQEYVATVCLAPRG